MNQSIKKTASGAPTLEAEKTKNKYNKTIPEGKGVCQV